LLERLNLRFITIDFKNMKEGFTRMTQLKFANIFERFTRMTKREFANIFEKSTRMTQLEIADYFGLKNARETMIEPNQRYINVYVDRQKMRRCGAGMFIATENIEGIIVDGSPPIHYSLH
jgi:hypothetical protein